MDIKYGYIQGEDKFFYMLNIIDIFDRIIVDYHMGFHCEAKDAAALLKYALMKRNLYGKEPVKTPNENAHVESFHRILEDECFKVNEFQSYSEAYEIVNNFIDFYNKRRLHSILKYMAPYEFHQLCSEGKLSNIKIKV
ncbi:integrase core domain-containing protein [Clostridium tyrobutyricum]|uniref:integrase core domain-containing protein n=1 Tax=Clostridium tyrobutyricum TaxID=1519 RepID=UPI0009BCC1B8|nr:integrase core domain-containing protein [Clostridium tyrobutyricum]